MSKIKLCTSCKRGEIEGIAASGPGGEQIQVTVLDPDSGRIELRGYLCEEHYSMYADDGFVIREDRRRAAGHDVRPVQD